jgi:methylated-DNA-[protein]-cysteine S-methyltransferase
MCSESNDIAYIKTPIGTAKITGNERGICSIAVIDENVDLSVAIPNTLKSCAEQLNAYFKGELREFDLKLNPQGTDFQKKVWNALLNVPYGTTRSYMEQTRTLGDEKAIRAVANANGKNPIWVVIPCHRIIGSDGSLTGYAGGKWRKKWLLNHENPSDQLTFFD